MTNSKTKNFSQNVSSSYYLRGECSNECKKDSLNVPKLRFEGYNEEWKKIKLGEHLNICRGASPRPIEKYITMQSNGINWIKIGDISPKENVIKTTKEKITEEGAKHSRYVRKGDLILSNSMSFGRPYILEIDGCIHDGWLLIQDLEKLFDKKYLCYLLDSDTVKHQYRKYAAGGVVINLNSELVRSVSVFIPKVQEQEKIASFLTLIDKKIEKQKELIELLKKYKRGLLSQIFSQKLRFKDDNENNYPDWEEKRLGDICTTFSGGTPSVTHQEYYNGEIPFIKSGEIHSDKTEMFITDIGLKNSSAKLVKKGDLLFALYGATSGEVDISKINGAINQAILCVQSDTLNLNYLKELLSYNKNKILCKYLQGGQGNLSADIFKSLKFKFPTKKEQDKISDFLINYDKITHIEEDLLNLYINYKQGLLQQLFI